MKTSDRVIINTGYLYAKMAITMFISLYTTRLILNSLGVSDFGIFNVVGGAIAMLGFLNAAMASATQRFINYAEGEGDDAKQIGIFNVSIVLHLLIALFTGIILLVAGYYFFHGVLNISHDRVPAAQVVYGCLIVSTMLTVMAVPYDAVINAHENMLYYAIVGVVESLLKLSVAFAVVYTASDKLVVYGILMACIPLVTLSIMCIYCHTHYAECVISVRKYYRRSLMKEMTSFAGWNFLATAASMIGNYGQGIIMNNFFGTALNAAQGVAGQLNGQLQVLSFNFMKAVSPVMGKSAGANDMELMRKSMHESARISSLLYLVVTIPVFVYAPYIMKIWLVNVPEWTVAFIRCMFIMNFIECLFIPISKAIYSDGRIKSLVWLDVVVNILPLFVVPIFFYMGSSPLVMYYILICVRVFLLVGLMSVGWNLGIVSVSYYLRNVLLPMLVFSTFLLVILFVIGGVYHCDNLIALLVSLCIYAIVFIVLLTFVVTKYERQLIKSLCTMMRGKLLDRFE